MHYRGSYSRRVMYTPVILSAALLGAGVWAFRSRRAAKTVLPTVSALTLADCAIGTYFHIRGIQRKPGGWRLPMTNIVMGPPVFGPLLFGTSAYLGMVASFLRREDGFWRSEPSAAGACETLGRDSSRTSSTTSVGNRDLREGRFQKHMAVATAISASCSGFEAFYSHYKSNFRYKAQWTPVLVAPLLAAAAARRGEESTRRADLASRPFKRSHAGWSGRIWLSRSRHPAPSGRIQDAGLQHHSRTANFRSIAICGSRFYWPVGEPDEERKAMNGDGRPMMTVRTIPALKNRSVRCAQPGYYPDFSTLAQQKFWDAKTREVILDRVHNIPPIRFFTPDEANLIEVICDHVIPQDDRDAAHKIPIVPWIDKRLYENRHDGYRFADMPPDREAFRLGFQAIEQIAHHLHGRGFADLDRSNRIVF